MAMAELELDILRRLSKNGVVALACATYIGLSRMTTNHMRIAVMLLFAWMVCKEVLELEVGSSSYTVFVHLLLIYTSGVYIRFN